MPKRMKSEQREHGRAVLARIADHGEPPVLRPHVKAFTVQQRALEAAAERAGRARRARDEALAAVARADGTLDAQVDVLANRLIGADLGPRKNPFSPFGEIPPARLKELGYALEVERVNDLLGAIKKVKPPRIVQDALSTCAAAASASARALAALTAPQAAYSAALGARDALLPEWTRAFERLRVNAKAVWIDQPGVYRAIFSPVGLEAARAGRRRRSRSPEPTPSSALPAAAASKGVATE